MDTQQIPEHIRAKGSQQSMGHGKNVIPVYVDDMPQSQLNRAGRRAQKRLNRLNGGRP